MKFQKKLFNLYGKLYAFYGKQRWWPADTPFEVMVGAILTQNTNWRNVEIAIANLKAKNLLSPQALKRAKTEVIARLIRPCGYYRQKAKRLKIFLDFFFREFNASIASMKQAPLDLLRKKLLAVSGIGPETADSIMLYALNQPVFVVDAYTRRILARHRFIPEAASYQRVQDIFMENLPRKTQLFNEYHALLVRLGKEYCRSAPQCRACPARSA